MRAIEFENQSALCYVHIMILMNYLLKTCKYCACVVVVMFGRYYLFRQGLETGHVSHTFYCKRLCAVNIIMGSTF